MGSQGSKPRGPPKLLPQQSQSRLRQQRQQQLQQQQGDGPPRPASSTFPLADLPTELLLEVAVRLPTAADAQRLLCQTSRALRQRVEGHLATLPAAWLLHNHPSTALTRAARHSNVPVLSALLAAPGERPDKDEALAAAAGKNHVAALEVLLAAGVAPQAGLVTAAGAGAREAVRALVAAGADPYADGGAAVAAACAGCHAFVLRDIAGIQSERFGFGPLPMRYGRVPAWYLRTLCHPIVAAARAGDWVAAEALLRSGVVDRGLPAPDRTYAVHVHRDELIAMAAEVAGGAGHGDVAMRLVGLLQDRETRGNAYYYALAAAACRGHVPALQRLMEGQHWDVLTSVLETACRYGRIEAVRVLGAAGTKVNSGVVDAAAGAYEGQAAAVAVLGVLLDGGAPDPRVWNESLRFACYCGQTSEVRALLEACRGRGMLDLEAALLFAVRRGHTAPAQILLEEGGARVEVLGRGVLSQWAWNLRHATRRVLAAVDVDYW